MGDVTIVNLPTEIQLTILVLLDVQSLLAIRQVRQPYLLSKYIVLILFRHAEIFVKLHTRNLYGCPFLKNNGNIFLSLTTYSIKRILISQTIRAR